MVGIRRTGWAVLAAALLLAGCSRGGGDNPPPAGPGTPPGGTTGEPTTGTSTGTGSGSGTTGGTTTGGTTTGTGTTGSGGGTTAGGTTTGGTTTGGTSGGTTTGGTSGGTTTGDDTGRNKVNLVASPDNGSCAYEPRGGNRPTDRLDVRFYLLINQGTPKDVGGAVPVRGSSDTGLTTSYRATPDNEKLTTAVFALRPTDFGRRHVLTIAVDSGDQATELDETDNRIRIIVQLPTPRPTATIASLPCTIGVG